MNFNNHDFQNLTKQVALKYFHKPFTNHAYLMNKHHKGTVGGYFNEETNNIHVKGKFLKMYGKPVFIDLIKHELCHYFIWKSGNHTEIHGKIFNYLLRQVGGLRYAPRLTKGKPVSIYFCTKCHQSYIFSYQLNLSCYHCKRCGGRLKCLYINSKAKHRLTYLKHIKTLKRQKMHQILKDATPKQRAFIKVFLDDRTFFHSLK